MAPIALINYQGITKKRNASACFVMHSMVGGTIMQSKGALINNTKYGHEHYISPTNQSHWIMSLGLKIL